MVAESGESVFGVSFERELEELVSFASSAFPPVDVPEGGKQRGCVLVVGSGVGVEQ